MDWTSVVNSSAALLIGAFLIDLATGDPRRFPHPVVLMGKLITYGERLLWSGNPRRDLVAGAFVALFVVGVSVAAGSALVAALSLLPPPLFFFFAAALASTTLATRGLLDSVSGIEKPLRAGNLPGAREALSHIVGRETGSLDRDGILRAGLESLAENTSDGIVAPLFYLGLGGIPLALAYKAVNTLDSMLGYRTERYLYFGRFAARLDDVLNFIPARLTGFLIAAAAWLMRLDGGRALAILRRDHANHPSPNAGYPEAALAGAFGIRLGGSAVYFGREIHKPYIGEEIRPVNIDMLQEGRWLGFLTAALSLAILLLLSLPFARS
jgi:adenosylcobinamide-phosphate synthase